MVDPWMAPFARFLAERRHVPERRTRFYVHWVDRLLTSATPGQDPLEASSVTRFLDRLGREKEPWQVQQAQDAIQAYLIYTHVAIRNRFGVRSPLDAQVHAMGIPRPA